MKDQVTALMEALRRVQIETERHRRRRQSATDAMRAIEAIVNEPAVAAAIQSLEPFMPSPGIAPEMEDHLAGHQV